ncbi:DUF2231 domain-containing protein [Mycolicibacterium sp. ND9-15]|uniref:DUF2231 domain-containing protein n=1 Tax=Mycolicibacterium sp. ND9-15 TaxID=3042320 RepID=UPI002DD8A676|nr:DUF2231 domain-containing protein [Mycolicibacterium sp. ND9-15]WSE57601.1 DUF2231 domain-containing protein [Mycolicibacterium sp. ND9-15]
MSEYLEQAKQPVSRLLAGPYGHPFHPILVTIPIGAWVCSLVFDIASHLVDRPGFLTEGSKWLIGIGVVGAGAAAMIGLLDLIAIPSGTPAFRIALIHMTLNLAVTVGYIANFAWRHSTPVDDTAVSLGPLVLSLISLAALGLSGYLGGMLSYRYGVRVARESVQAEGYQKQS